MTVYVFGSTYDLTGKVTEKGTFDKDKLIELFQIAIDAKGTDKYDSVIDDIGELIGDMTDNIAVETAIMAVINGDDLIDSHTIEAMTERFNKIKNGERLGVDMEECAFGIGMSKNDAKLAYVDIGETEEDDDNW